MTNGASSGLDIETSTHRCTNVAGPHPGHSWSLMSFGTVTTRIFHRVERWMLDVFSCSVFGTVLQELRYWLSRSRQVVSVELVQVVPPAQPEQEPLAPEVK